MLTAFVENIIYVSDYNLSGFLLTNKHNKTNDMDRYKI